MMKMKVTTSPTDNDGERSGGPVSPDDGTSSSSSREESSSSVSSPLAPRILSGSVGSIVTALAVTPLEVVKVRQQAAGFDAGGGGGARAGNVAAPSYPTYFRGVKVEPCPAGCGTLVLNNGLMDCVVRAESTACLRSPPPFHSSLSMPTKTGAGGGGGGTLATLLSIFRNEGYPGLYAGLRPTLVMSVPNTVLYFTAYDEISARMRRNHRSATSDAAAGAHDSTRDDDARRQAYIPLVAGSTARLVASLATAPLELVRTRQASFVSSSRGAAATAPPGMMEEFRLLLRTNGVASLYVGVAPTLWRDVPFSALYWLFLERFRNALADSNDLGVWGGEYYKSRGAEIPPGVETGHAFVSGAAAGSIAAAFTTPFDVVKTRRQMVGQVETLAIDSCDHLGLKEYSDRRNKIGNLAGIETFGHMRQIVRQEGIAGLWKGNLTRMAKVTPACAVMISCYEFGKRFFGEVL